jgi:hypothetical protein
MPILQPLGLRVSHTPWPKAPRQKIYCGKSCIFSPVCASYFGMSDPMIAVDNVIEYGVYGLSNYRTPILYPRRLLPVHGAKLVRGLSVPIIDN